MVFRRKGQQMRPAHLHFCGSLGSGPTRNPRAFSLIELLVTVSIIALLVSILSTTLVKVRAAGRDFVCKNKKKTIAAEFFHFADDNSSVYRGPGVQPGGKWPISNFVDSLYGIGDFSKNKATPGDTYDPSKQPMICPSEFKTLTRARDPGGNTLSCSAYKAAFVDWSSISTGTNYRLHKKPRLISGSLYIPWPAELNSRVLDKIMAPIAFDVDGEAAATQNTNAGPLFGTVDLNEIHGRTDPAEKVYKGKWHGALRHNKRMNVAFVGGHVLSSSDPENESGWKWAYYPD
jgi:prepilin-type N-terminal cleavage/methylation domain-containing protein/prepilin-type processing-associated H-X9-DG protein